LKTAEETLNSTSAQLKELKDVQKTLETQRYVNTILSKENADLILQKEKLNDEIRDLQKICNSWGRATKIVYNCIDQQFPKQHQAVMKGDFKTAVGFSDFKFKNDSEASASNYTADENENDDSSNDEFDEIIERDLQERKNQIPIRPMGRMPPPTVYHDPKKKGMVISDAAKRPQPWNNVASRPPFRKQTQLAGTPPPKPTYSKNKNEASSSSGKRPIDPIKELTIQMSSLTNQIKQLKEKNAKQGIGHNSPKQKCHICGERTHSADDCFSKKKSSSLKTDEATDKSSASSASSSKVKSSVSRQSSEEPTTVWVPKKI
jgi:hypothetical protein